VLHPASNRSKKIYYHQVKNRWLFIIKNYSTRTIVVILPALLFYESAQLVFMILTRGVRAYFTAIFDIMKNWPMIYERRQMTLMHKQVSDSGLLCSGDFMSSQLIINHSIVKKCILLINVMLDKYWVLARRLI
jgi:hypothetical protein